MNISDIFKQKECVYSFETFPPKKDSGLETIAEVMAELSSLKPDYISVTYSAGGGDNTSQTLQLCKMLKSNHGVEPLMHLTCRGNSEKKISEILQELKSNGISNILALRGDKKDGDNSSDFNYASDLIKFIKKDKFFNVVGACYPEGHVESVSLTDDIDSLKIKVDNGASHLITQLFFDNEDFFRFKEKAVKAGVNVPIQPGVMPIVRPNQIDRIISLAGVKIPSRMSRMIAKYQQNTDAIFDAGINYASEQISDLVAGGAQGIHVYVMNNVQVAKAITNNINKLIR